MAGQFKDIPEYTPPRAAPAIKEPGELLTYLPGDGDPVITKWRGIEFKANVPTRVTDPEHINVARGNKFFRVGDEVAGDNPHRVAEDAMEYRAYVVDWIADVSTVDQLILHWAADRNIRIKCEVADDDVRYLGTLIEPKLRAMRLAEGLSDMQVAEMWIKRGVLDIPWRA